MKENKKKGKTKGKEKVKALIAFLILFVISVGMIVGGVLLISKSEIAAAALLLIGAIWFFGNFAHLKQTLGKIKRSFCSKCGARFDYNHDIAWTESQVENGATKHTATFEIECRCPECGNSDYHKTKAVIAYYDKSKNTWVQKNVRSEARKLFIK